MGRSSIAHYRRMADVQASTRRGINHSKRSCSDISAISHVKGSRNWPASASTSAMLLARAVKNMGMLTESHLGVGKDPPATAMVVDPFVPKVALDTRSSVCQEMVEVHSGVVRHPTPVSSLGFDRGPNNSLYHSGEAIAEAFAAGLPGTAHTAPKAVQHSEHGRVDEILDAVVSPVHKACASGRTCIGRGDAAPVLSFPAQAKSLPGGNEFEKPMTMEMPMEKMPQMPASWTSNVSLLPTIPAPPVPRVGSTLTSQAKSLPEMDELRLQLSRLRSELLQP